MIVIGTTLCSFAMSKEQCWSYWLANADAIKASHPAGVQYFAAIEIDARGLAPFKPLVDRLEQIGGAYWTYSLDDGRTTISTANRLRHIVTGQNLVTDYATTPGFSHLLFMAADCAPPPDALPKLLEVNHPLVGGEVTTYCVDDATEALTKNGWKHRWEINPDDELLGLDPNTNTIHWSPLLDLHVFNHDGPLTRYRNRTFDAFTTDEHRWLIEPQGTNKRVFETTNNLSTKHTGARLILGGGTPFEFANTPVFSDEFVELVGWTVTEGYYAKRGYSVVLRQSQSVNPEYCERIRSLGKHFAGQGATFTERPGENANFFYFGKGIGILLRQSAPNKQLTPAFLCSLTISQAHLLYETLLAGDGAHAASGQIVWAQKDQGRLDSFQMLCSMLGLRSHLRPHSQSADCSLVSVYRGRGSIASRVGRLHVSQEPYSGKVWCPTLDQGVFMARRNGFTYWTGNCLSGSPVPKYTAFPVQEHMATAAFIFIERQVFKRLRWRWDVEAGMTDDPCYHYDAKTLLGIDTYVRKDCIGRHFPEAIGGIETRGYDMKVVRSV